MASEWFVGGLASALLMYEGVLVPGYSRCTSFSVGEGCFDLFVGG